jgi:SAM-dependent methyltransferase
MSASPITGRATNHLRRAMQRMWEEAEADYRRRLLASVPHDPSARMLDVGCDDGEWTSAVAGAAGIPPGQTWGIEIVEERRRLAEARGYRVRAADLDARWPFDDASFELVHANQVIEHVHRLDHFVTEVRRVLVPGGRAVICTENLASWHNVGALVAGWMPFSLTNISEKGTVGNPVSLHRGETPAHTSSWQHTRVLSLKGLRAIFTMHGLDVTSVFASGYYPAFGRVGAALSRRDPAHAHFIGVVARRPHPG